MKKNIIKIFSLIIVFVILAANVAGDVTLFAADNVVRDRVSLDFEDGIVQGDRISVDTNAEITDADSIGDSRSLLIYNCDIAWEDLDLNAYSMAVEFKFKCSADFAGKLDLYFDTEGTGSSSKHIFSITHQNNVLSLIDSTGSKVHTFSYNTVYKIKAVIQRGSDTYSIYINDTRLDIDPGLSGSVFSVDSVNLLMNQSGTNSFVILDDLRIFTQGKSYPQKYSSQEEGTFEVPEIKESSQNDEISLYINSSKIYFPKALYADNNTVFVPAERLFESVGMEYTENNNSVTVINDNLNLVFSADSNIVTINGTNIVLNYSPVNKNGIMYVPLNLINEALNANVWWDEAAGLVVVTTGQAKNDNVLKNIGGKFYMNGQPYYEISFLYENLLRDIWTAYRNNGETVQNSSAYNNAKQVLANMQSLGFKSIRTYFWDENCYSVMQSSADKEIYYKAIDLVLELCDQYGIRVIPCLGLNSSMFLSSYFVEGYGWASVNENVVDLVSDKESSSRKEMLKFLDEFIKRYKERSTILMWELCDGANISADCGATNGTVAYSLLQLSEFYKECAEHINAQDGTRLISGGDGLLRPAQWHLFSAVMAGESEDWNYDNGEERLKALTLLSESLDVISIHAFDVGVTTNAESFYADENGAKIPLTFSYMKKEAESLGKIIYNGATNGVIDYTTADGTTSQTLDGQIRYLDSIVESGIQISHWQLNKGESLDEAFFSRNALSKSIADANTVLAQRYVVNKAAVDNTNVAWTDGTLDIFDPDDIIPGNESQLDTVFLFGIIKIVSAAVLTIALILIVILFMQKNENSQKRSNRKNG